MKRLPREKTARKPDQPPLGGCVLKPVNIIAVLLHKCQPPLGGCVLKQLILLCCQVFFRQPPLGGCVLKLVHQVISAKKILQPPLGGCVLKLNIYFHAQPHLLPAAFRRLCVETVLAFRIRIRQTNPAAFRRLCVETSL